MRLLHNGQLKIKTESYKWFFKNLDNEKNLK